MNSTVAKYLRKKAKEQTLLPEKEYYKMLKKAYGKMKNGLINN